MFAVPMMGVDKWLELAPHSRFLSFIEGLRPVFLYMMTLPEYSKDFVGIDPDAHFVCTVVHSLDHLMAGHYFTQPQNIAQFFGGKRATGNMNLKATGDWVALASGLTSDFPKMFEVYMRSSPMEFYRRVYHEASLLDPELAWHMQCCITK